MPKKEGWAVGPGVFWQRPIRGGFKEKPKLSKEEKARLKEEKAAKKIVDYEAKADKFNKKLRKDMKDILVDYKTPDSLTIQEKEFYKKIGKPIDGQDYLEILDPMLIHDLKEIMHATFKQGNTSVSSNQMKATLVLKHLKPLGFFDVGLGTNIITVGHEKYPGVVFKIALDRYGVNDNLNDEWLYAKHPDMYARYICRDSSATVSVQEAYAVIRTKARMRDFLGQAFDMITRLERNYLICDISPENYKNYGVKRDGRLVILDGSDLIPMGPGQDLLRCKRIIGMKNGKPVICKTKLHYTEDYNRIVCERCKNEYVPYALRPRFVYDEKEELMSLITTGLSPKEMRKLDDYIEDLIVKSGFSLGSDDSAKQKVDAANVEYDIKLTAEDLKKQEILDASIEKYGLNKSDPRYQSTRDLMLDMLGMQSARDNDDDSGKPYDPFAHDDEEEDLPEGEPPEENLETLEDENVEALSNSEVLEFSPGAEFPWSKADTEIPDLNYDRVTLVSGDVSNDVVSDENDEESKRSVSDTVGAIMASPIICDSESMGEDDEDADDNADADSEIIIPDKRAELDISFSDDPCALNISVTGSFREAFMNDGPSIYLAVNGDDDYQEVAGPNVLCKFIMQLLDNRGIKYTK